MGKFVLPVFRGWQLAVVALDQMFPVLIGNLSSLTSMHAKWWWHYMGGWRCL